jgi:hypothetical protein
LEVIDSIKYVAHLKYFLKDRSDKLPYTRIKVNLDKNYVILSWKLYSLCEFWVIVVWIREMHYPTDRINVARKRQIRRKALEQRTGISKWVSTVFKIFSNKLKMWRNSFLMTAWIIITHSSHYNMTYLLIKTWNLCVMDGKTPGYLSVLNCYYVFYLVIW